MFDRDLGTAAIVTPRSCCPVPRASMKDGPDMRQPAGLAPCRRALSRPPPRPTRIPLLTGQPVMTGHDHAPADAGTGRRGNPPSCTLAGIPGSVQEGALRVHADPHTAPALFAADVPATLASRK